MSEQIFFSTVVLPILTGALILFFKEARIRRNIACLVFLASLYACGVSFFKPQANFIFSLSAEYSAVLGLNSFSRLVLVFINLFSFLVCLYSKDFLELKDKRAYFSCLLWLAAFSGLVCFACDFLLFIFAWGANLILLYALLSFGSAKSANKALSIVGTADFIFLLGAGLYVFSSGSLLIPSEAVSLNSPLAWPAFIMMLIGALAKAGCGPFHTWIPKAAEDTPLPIMAILPASLDKLLGIYLLVRICLDFFVLNSMAIAILLITGGLTIMFAVAMALIQHDLRKLLSYHAISQVGYMVLGVATANPLGIAGAVFHMVNHAIYKSGLFLTGGVVGEKKKTFELKELGGIAAYMPLTFICGLVFSFSISGIPPFNGFASKWMIYQGVLIGLSGSQSAGLRFIFLFALIAAMFGSVLTLASFIKFIHAIFLGQEQNPDKKKAQEVSFNMGFPLVLLAVLCLGLGVLPHLFLSHFIQPWIGQDIYFIGSWNSVLAFLLICAGLHLGWIFYGTVKDKKLRRDDFFIGGEQPVFNPAFPATEFYRGIEEMPFPKRFYSLLKLEKLDLFNLISALLKISAYLIFVFVDRFINLLTGFCGYAVLGASWVFRRMHSGVLDFYLVWSLLGLLIIFAILMLR